MWIKINITDVVCGKADDLFMILQDYENYFRWWNVPVSVDNNKPNCIRITPLPFIHVTIRESRCIENTEINFRYFEGPFSGTGTWNLDPDEKNNRVFITYKTFLQPKNIFFTLFTSMFLYKRKHIADIKVIIKRLEKMATMSTFP